MHRHLLALLTILAITGCGDDTPVPPPTTLRPCTDLHGQPTMAVVDSACIDGDGREHVYMSFSYDCPDGHTLYWNDTGWGYSNGAWQKHARADGQLVPPDADMSRCQP